jgi:predicted adenylyl cyclase CyaB
MGHNIEFKARIADFDALRRKAESWTAEPPTVFEQEDTFFNSPSGRLKLRIAGGSGELITYERPDTPGPKHADYFVYPVVNAEGLKRILARSLGVRGVVRKMRHLFLKGATRLHLDRVEGLGDFMEIEVVLESADSLEEGRREAQALMTEFGIHHDDLIDNAYIDLLRDTGAEPEPR